MTGPIDRTLKGQIQRYLLWLEVRGYAKGTVKQRRCQLLRFAVWCEDRSVDRIPQVTRPLIQRYQQSLYHAKKKDGRPLSRRHQHSLLSALSVWFSWLVKEELALTNPASDLELPKYDRRLPSTHLSVTEIESVLNGIALDTRLGLRDRAILETFYSTGIRRAELSALELYDLDPERGLLVIRRGKGDQERVVPIGARALAWVEKYLIEVRPGLMRDSTQTLFVTKQGRCFSMNALTKLAKKHLAAAELDRPGTGCHLFRHSTATLMLEAGADIRFIQELLGHRHLTSTQVYTKVTIQKLKDVHTKTHPARLEKPKAKSEDELDEGYGDE